MFDAHLQATVLTAQLFQSISWTQPNKIPHWHIHICCSLIRPGYRFLLKTPQGGRNIWCGTPQVQRTPKKGGHLKSVSKKFSSTSYWNPYSGSRRGGGGATPPVFQIQKKPAWVVQSQKKQQDKKIQIATTCEFFFTTAQTPLGTRQ